MSKHTPFLPVFLAGDNQYLLPSLCACLSAPKVTSGVVRAVLEILENLLESTRSLQSHLSAPQELSVTVRKGGKHKQVTEEKHSPQEAHELAEQARLHAQLEAFWRRHVSSVLSHMHLHLSQMTSAEFLESVAAAHEAKNPVAVLQQKGKGKFASKRVAAPVMPKRQLAIVSGVSMYATDAVLAQQVP
jgi:hypothetical protein